MGKFSNSPAPEPRSLREAHGGCAVAKLLNSPELDADDIKAINDRLADLAHYSDESVTNWLRGLGAPIGNQAVQRHRRGVCCGGKGKVR